MNKIIITILVLFFFSCSDNSPGRQVENTSTISLPYYGTYLYTDNDCGGQDIQYATIDLDGIAFFDLLSDGCDDTVECYMLNEYDLIEVSSDTFLVTLSDNTSEIYGEIYLQGDSLFTITYENNNGSWNQLGSDIDGEGSGDRFGGSVVLSSDGNRLPAGSVEGGYVKIYEYSNGSWSQLGNNITGSSSQFFGVSIDMNDNGTQVIVGAPYGGSGRSRGVFLLTSSGISENKSSIEDNPIVASISCSLPRFGS